MYAILKGRTMIIKAWGPHDKFTTSSPIKELRDGAQPPPKKKKERNDPIVSIKAMKNPLKKIIPTQGSTKTTKLRLCLLRAWLPMALSGPCNCPRIALSLAIPNFPALASQPCHRSTMTFLDVFPYGTHCTRPIPSRILR